MLEYLPSNHKALGLVPITEKSIQFNYCKILISLSLKYLLSTGKNYEIY